MARHLLSCAFLILAACQDSAPAPAQSRQASASACEERSFEGDRFVVCDAGKGRVDLVAAARNEAPVRNFSQLEGRLGTRAANVAFAMNAGMFGEDGRPIGL